MVREDCPEKVVFKQIPERKEEAKLCGYQQEEHSSWRELSRMCTCWKDKEGNNVAEWAKGKDPEQDREVARARSGTLRLLFEWGEAALRLWWQEGMNWPSYSLYPSSCQYLLMSLSTFLYSPIISPKLYFLAPATLNSRLLPNSPLLLTPDFLWLLAPTTINSITNLTLLISC